MNVVRTAVPAMGVVMIYVETRTAQHHRPGTRVGEGPLVTGQDRMFLIDRQARQESTHLRIELCFQ